MEKMFSYFIIFGWSNKEKKRSVGKIFKKYSFKECKFLKNEEMTFLIELKNIDFTSGNPLYSPIHLLFTLMYVALVTTMTFTSHSILPV